MVQSQIPWSTFFDLDSFSLHIPVVEFVEFLNGLYKIWNILTADGLRAAIHIIVLLWSYSCELALLADFAQVV